MLRSPNGQIVARGSSACHSKRLCTGTYGLELRDFLRTVTFPVIIFNFVFSTLYFQEGHYLGFEYGPQADVFD